MMEVSMASEINVLGHQLNLLSEKNRRSRDFTLNSLTHAIREIIACFPVYRTYVTDPEQTADRDRAYLNLAVARAKRRNPAVTELVFDFVRDLLLMKYPAERSEEDRQAHRRFAMKFQQTTSPVMAKGVEDTSFYIYHRLISLNEVGGHPGQFGIDTKTFHQWMRERQARRDELERVEPIKETIHRGEARARSERRISSLSNAPRGMAVRNRPDGRRRNIPPADSILHDQGHS